MPVPDSELAVRARGGDVDAFGDLARRHSARAYRVALAIVHSHEEAQDIAQESLLAAWLGMPTFRAECSFTTWLHAIATRKALSAVTRPRRTVSDEAVVMVADRRSGPGEQCVLRARREELNRAVEALPAPQGMSIALHLEGESYQDIAKRTGTTVASVRSHLYRGRRELKNTMLAWR